MWTRPLACVVMLLVAIFAVACDDSGNTTIINGLDCELIRDHLIGSWTVGLAPALPSLQNCTGLAPGLSGTVVGTDDFPATYSSMDVFGSDGSTSFKLQADRSDSGGDASQSIELTGSVQADSCLALIRVWSTTDLLYFQCIGTFVISNQTLFGECDSAEIDSDTDGQLDTSCSLSGIVDFDAIVN